MREVPVRRGVPRCVKWHIGKIVRVRLLECSHVASQSGGALFNNRIGKVGMDTTLVAGPNARLQKKHAELGKLVGRLDVKREKAIVHLGKVDAKLKAATRSLARLEKRLVAVIEPPKKPAVIAPPPEPQPKP